MSDTCYLTHIEHPISAAQIDGSVLRAGIGRGVINGVAETLINLNGHRIPAGRATVRKAGDRWLIDCSIELMENGWEPLPVGHR